jgi:ribose 5-phosphate isomerase B
MKIAIGSDHRGYLLKEQIESMLVGAGHDVRDVGAPSEESVDYPDFAGAVSDLVGRGEYERGILICGSGIGMSIAANKHRGVRGALCTSLTLAEFSRRHNDSNVLCLGSQNQSPEEALRMVDLWLKTEFEGGRHGVRLEKIRKMEE